MYDSIALSGIRDQNVANYSGRCNSKTTQLYPLKDIKHHHYRLHIHNAVPFVGLVGFVLWGLDPIIAWDT